MHTLIFYLNRSCSSIFVLAPLVVVPHFDLADLLESLIIVIHVWHGVFVPEKAYFAADEWVLLLTIAVGHLE